MIRIRLRISHRGRKREDAKVDVKPLKDRERVPPPKKKRK